MLEFLKTRSRRSIAAVAPKAAELAASQVTPPRQTDLLQLILDNMAEGVIVCDRGLRLVQFNRGAVAIAGADLRGSDLASEAKKYQALPFQGAQPLEAGQWPLARAMTGETVDNAQFLLRGPPLAAEGGSAASGRPVPTNDGEPPGGLLVLWV